MTGSPTPDRDDEARQTHERLVLPLVVPAIVFLFAVLVIYGLSRIYIDLETWHYRSVGMATPLAIGVALTILLVSTYLAGKPVPRWQIGFIVLLASGGLAGGATWAAVHTESVPAKQVVASPTAGGATPVPGAISVTLHDSPFQVTADPASVAAGSVTFSVTNTGSIIHNFNVIKTELDPAKLPIDSTGFLVDVTQVDVVQKGKELDPKASEAVTAQLQPGKYVLICNIATHYQSGMRVAFTVQ
jgi:uncharacterized cupredoxin-like copper-binding protein